MDAAYGFTVAVAVMVEIGFSPRRNKKNFLDSWLEARRRLGNMRKKPGWILPGAGIFEQSNAASLDGSRHEPPPDRGLCQSFQSQQDD